MKRWQKNLAYLGLTTITSLSCFQQKPNLSAKTTIFQAIKLDRTLEGLTQNDSQFFSGDELEELRKSMTGEIALSFFKNDSTTYSAIDIIRYSLLGVKKQEVDDFLDTKKPNAVLLFPGQEKEISRRSAFYNRPNRYIIDSLRTEYDLLVRIINTEDEIGTALDVSKNAELLFLAGHGSKSQLVLGEPQASLLKETESGVFEWDKNSIAPERYTLNSSDSTDLRKYFAKLNPSAVIFLSSCATAEEDNQNNNFANTVSEAAGYRTVIAAKKPFTTSEIILDSVYPFSARIVVNDTNVTYNNTISNIGTKALKAISPIKKN